MTGESIQLFPPGAAGGSVTPAFEDWNFVTVTTSKTPAAGDWNLVTASGVTLTLPIGLAVGNRIAVTRFNLSPSEIFVQAGAGETINGSSADLFMDAAYNTQPSVVLIKVSSTGWEIESMAGSDLTAGFLFSGPLQYAAGLIGHTVPKSSAYAIVSSDDTILCTGSFTLTFGANLATGQHITVVNVGAGVITLAAASAGTFTGPTVLTAGQAAKYQVQAAGGSPTVNIESFWANIGTPSVTTILANNATWPIPVGATQLEVTVVAGGGGGGGAAGSSTTQIGAAGAGGAAGGAVTQIMSVGAATTLAVVVGGGGNGGGAGTILNAAPGGNGIQGSTSSVTNASTSQVITTNGGGPGLGGAIGGSVPVAGGLYARNATSVSSALLEASGGVSGTSNTAGVVGGPAVGPSSSGGGGGGGANAGVANGTGGLAGVAGGTGGLQGAGGGGGTQQGGNGAANSGGGGGGAGGTATVAVTGAVGAAGGNGGSGYVVIRVIA